MSINRRNLKNMKGGGFFCFLCKIFKDDAYCQEHGWCDKVITEKTQLSELNLDSPSSPLLAQQKVSGPLKVLIVVDVQNCFIGGGSMDEKKEDDKLKNSIKQVREIERLIDNEGTDLIVFTRDFHPQYHSSFKAINQGTLFENHCRNTQRKCDNMDSWNDTRKDLPIYESKYTTIEEILKSKGEIIKEVDLLLYNELMKNHTTQQVIGTDLSYLFLGTKFNSSILQLIKDKTYTHTIGLKDEKHKGHPNIDELHKTFNSKTLYPFTDPQSKKQFISLTKGEYCDYDSYSAFNYHQDQSKKWPGQYMSVNKKNSTGLCEFLESYLGSNKKYTSIDFTVCGLVGNICVMNTVHNGYLMTRLYNNPIIKNSTFTYSCPGTLWLMPYFDDLKEQPKMTLDNRSEDCKKALTWIEQDAQKMVTEYNPGKQISYKIQLNSAESYDISVNDISLIDILKVMATEIKARQQKSGTQHYKGHNKESDALRKMEYIINKDTNKDNFKSVQSIYNKLEADYKNLGIDGVKKYFINKDGTYKEKYISYGSEYEAKYLKYKQKYLELKKLLNQ